MKIWSLGRALSVNRAKICDQLWQVHFVGWVQHDNPDDMRSLNIALIKPQLNDNRKRREGGWNCCTMNEFHATAEDKETSVHNLSRVS